MNCSSETRVLCCTRTRCEDASHSQSPAPAGRTEWGSQRILREALSECDASSHRVDGLQARQFATRYAMARGVTKGAQSQKQMARDVKSPRDTSAKATSWSQAELLCAGSVFVVALVVYSWTLAPTVTPTDSGELILAAYGLGVAHPPGVPLWIMLAHLASLVPVGNVAVRINFSSAVFAALACAMLTLVVAELLVTASCFSAPRRRNKAARQGSNVESSNVDGLLIFAPAVGAGLLIAFSRTLWSYATITEVYTLNAFLVLLVFFLVVRCGGESLKRERIPARRWRHMTHGFMPPPSYSASRWVFIT
jgi:Protein of unknown function (DUF2723)